MFPNCVILGAQKPGSTFLHRCLGEHPEVFTPKREVDFFGAPTARTRSTDSPRSSKKGRTRIHLKKPGPLGRVAHWAVRALDNRVLKHLFTNRKPNLSPYLKSRLHELYRDDIEQLEKLSGRDLSGWKG